MKPTNQPTNQIQDMEFSSIIPLFPTNQQNRFHNQLTNKTNSTNQTVLKTILLFFLSSFLFLPSVVFALDFDGSLKGVTITDTSGTNTPPSAVISHTIVSENPLIADFDANGSADSDGSISEYRWDFGDGTTGTGVTIIKQFTSSGDFTITLTTVDNKGGMALAQITISNKSCSETATLSQLQASSANKIGNFSNVYYQGMSYNGATSLNVCSVDISMKQYSGDISTKTFYLAVYSLDFANNFSEMLAVSEPVGGQDIATDCTMTSFSFEIPVTIAANSAIIVYMDGEPDSKNYAAACSKSFNEYFSDGALGSWNQNGSLNLLSTNGSDLSFMIYETN